MTKPTYTAADLEAAVKRALEWAADKCHADAGRFDTPDRIRAADPATVAKLARGE